MIYFRHMSIWPKTENPPLRVAVVVCSLLCAAVAMFLVSGSVRVFFRDGFNVFNAIVMIISVALLYVSFCLWRMRIWARRVASILLPVSVIMESIVCSIGLPFESTQSAYAFVLFHLFGVAAALGSAFVLSLNTKSRIPRPLRWTGWIILLLLVGLLTAIGVPNTMRLDEARRKTETLCNYAKPGMPIERVEIKAKEIGQGYNRYPREPEPPTSIVTVPSTFFYRWQCSIVFEDGVVSKTKHDSSAM